MKLADTTADKKLYGHCGILPDWQELKSLKVGNYLRLKAKNGDMFWALAVKQRGDRFICRMDDAADGEPRGALCSCGCDDIFGIV